MLRWLTAGESHGPALTATLEGLPAGVAITSDDIRAQLARRRLGYGRGARMAFEQDAVEVLGGVRHGLTLGSPVSVVVHNTEWPKWTEVMSPDPVDPEVLAEAARDRAADAPAARPCRSGRHAEVRLRRRPAGAGARVGAGDRRPRRARHVRPGTAAAGVRGDDPVPRRQPRPGRRPGRHAAARAGRPRPHRRRPGALRRSGDGGADGRRGRRRQARRRHPGRRGRGARLRAAAGSRQSRPRRPPARFPARRRAHGDPGHQGRRTR